MFFLLVRIGRFIALGGRDNEHISFRGFRLCLDSHSTSRSQHSLASLGSAETSIHQHGDARSLQGIQLVVEFAHTISRGYDAALAIHRQEVSRAIAFVWHSMTRIIEDKLSLLAIRLGYVLHPVDFCQHIVQGGIPANMYITLR